MCTKRATEDPGSRPDLQASNSAAGSGTRRPYGERVGRNVAWNLAGGTWLALLLVLVTPWYVSRLGLDGYGIVSFWLALQVLLGLLDAGLGATVIRQFASRNDGTADHRYKHELLSTLELVYWAMAAGLAIVFMPLASGIGAQWLQTTLASGDLSFALGAMVLALSAQFPFLLYFNGLAGLQRHGLTNAVQMASHGLRYGGGAVLLWWLPNLPAFFAYQVVVSLVQTFLACWVLRRTLGLGVFGRRAFKWALLRPLLNFSLGMAVTSVAAALLSTVDRLILSRMVTMSELGVYALACTAAGILQLAILPFYRVFFPRYAELSASGDTARLRAEYFDSCRLMGALLIPLGVMAWVFAPDLFRLWLNENQHGSVDAFRWLLVGMTAAGLVWLPAAFQQAQGATALHATMMAAALLVGVPVSIYCVIRFGPVGAAGVWVVHGLLGLLVEVPLAHRRFLHSGSLHWYRIAVIGPLLMSLPIALASLLFRPAGLEPLWTFAWMMAAGIVAVIVAVPWDVVRQRL